METISPDDGEILELDFLIAASGSDTRGTDVLRKHGESGTNVGKALLLEFSERTSLLSKDDLDKQRQEFDSCGVPLVRVQGAMEEPITCVAGLEAEGLVPGLNAKVGVDMTLFTRPFLFWLLKYLSRILKTPEVCVYYTEPESYRYASGTFDTYEATIGPLQVREVPGFPGTPAYGTSALTVLLGFDGQLATAINEDVAPMKTFVVNGFPSYFQKYKDISLVNNERLVTGAHKILYSAAGNPFETYNVLSTIRRDAPAAFMTVAPLGPKPMALGACLFAIEHDDVRVVYPRPRQYVVRTTRASWQSWRYDVGLGSRSST